MDLTDAKMAEQALRASEARLQEVFDHTTEVIFVVKVAADGTFLYERINRAAAAFGLNAADFNAGTKTPRDIFPPHAASSIEGNYRKCIEARQPLMVEQELAMPTGVFYFAATLVPVFDAEGATIVRIVGFSQDVTARRNADAALRASEEKYRGIFESAIEGIFRSSPEGRYLSVNPSMARMNGYESPEEMIASVTDIATEIYADPAERLRILARIEREGRLDNQEMQVRRNDGSLMWVMASLRAVRDHGEGAVL